MPKQYSLMWVPLITFEKVKNAKNLLGLPDVCSRKEIRSGYLMLAKEWHPDVSSKTATESNKRFREISNAWNYMRYLIEHYRYSLREEDIKRYQESQEMKFERRFGGGLWTGEIEDPDRFKDDFVNPNIRRTAENVVFARQMLGVLDLTTSDAIESQFYETLKKNNRINDESILKLRNAKDFLLDFLSEYRYVLTEDAIRSDQEDPLAKHRRQFGNEPLWSGGIYDNPFYENSNEKNGKKKTDGRFAGIC